MKKTLASKRLKVKKEVLAALDNQYCEWLLSGCSTVLCGKVAPYRATGGYSKGELRCYFHWRPTPAAWAAYQYRTLVVTHSKPGVLHRENDRLIAAWRKQQEKAA